MPVGVLLKRALNPIRNRVSKAIGECNAYSASTAQYVGSASVIGECIETSSGSLAKTSSSSVIGECIEISPVWSNQQMSSSSVIGECVFTQRFPGSVDIYDDGVLIKSSVKHIDIRGTGARTDIDGTGVDIWHPTPTYSSHFNTSDGSNVATVADISATSRIVSTPSGGEGTPFYTNGWAAASHDVTKTSPLVWVSANECSFIDGSTTTFEITILDGDSPQNTTVNYTTAAITGNGVYSGSDCTVTISNWTDESDKFSGDVEISIDINATYPAGGYFDITLTHHNGADGDFTKSQ
jgi:hypothetical protein